MRSQDARILRSAAVPTLVAGVVAMVCCLLLAGTQGLVGAVLGVLLVVLFFALGQLALGYCSTHFPMALLPAALGVYVVQILLVAIATGLLRQVDFFDSQSFGFTALACTLIWMAGQIRGFVKTKTFYVEPTSTAKAPAGQVSDGTSDKEGSS